MEHQKINKTFLIVLLGILAAIGPFTIDMYLPGFHKIAEDFETSEQSVAFTLTSYFVGIAIGQLFYGPIIDKYGRKKPLLFGLFVYFIAAIGCSISGSISTMMVMRFFQALGGCAGMVASTAIITDVYKANDRARAFSLIMLVMGVAPLIAPSLGSFFVVHLSWNYIFYFLAVFSAGVFMLIYFFLPETSRFIHHRKLRTKRIVINYWSILRNKRFLYFTLSGSIVMSILFAYISSASFIFLSYYKLDKSTFSILFGINASGLISGTYINGWLSKKYNYLRIGYYASYALLFISTMALIFIWMTPNMPFQWVVVGLFSILFSIGFINPNALAASMVPFSGNAGAASALGGSIRMTSAALIAAVIGSFQSSNTKLMFFIIFVLSLLNIVFYIILPKSRQLVEKR